MWCFCDELCVHFLIIELKALAANSAMSHHNRIFRGFNKSDRSDISANVIDICLCVNTMLDLS